MNAANLFNTNLSGANLSGAILNGAHLSEANLSEAILSEAILSWANLSDANLSDATLYMADLSNTNLSGANLIRAILSDANLIGANICNTIGNMRELKSAQFDRWSVTWSADVLAIGCQQHPIEKWRNADPRWIEAMDGSARDWWSRYGALVLQLIDASPATGTILQVVPVESKSDASLL